MPGSWTVIGRGRELDAVAAFLAGVPSGLLLECQAGIGKTTVWMAGVADAAASQTTRFLHYHKWQDGTLRMTELQTFRLQHWSRQKFADLLAKAGFTHILVAADYQDAC